MLPDNFKSSTQFYLLFGILILTLIVAGIYVGFLR